MRLDVFFGGHQITPADVQGRVVLVIDVLRASTTVAVALANGAKAVIPFESSDEVVARAKHLERDDVLLAGERRMHAIPGFDLGNSPREYTRRRWKVRRCFSRRRTARSRSPESRAHVTSSWHRT